MSDPTAQQLCDASAEDPYAFEASFRPVLFSHIASSPSTDPRHSLEMERYLAERFEEDPRRIDCRPFLLELSDEDSSISKTLTYDRQPSPRFHKSEPPDEELSQIHELQENFKHIKEDYHQVKQQVLQQEQPRSQTLIDKLQQQNKHLSKAKHSLESKYAKLKPKLRSLKKELHKAKTTQAAQNSELQTLAQGKARDDALIAQLQQELAGLRTHAHQLEEHLYIENAQDFQRQVKELTEQVENLTLELDSRPTHKQYKEALHRLRELETAPRPRSTSCVRSSHVAETARPILAPLDPRSQTRQQIRKDRELHKLPRGTTPSEATLKVLAKELMEALQLENVGEIMPSVRSLQQHSFLAERLSKLMGECCAVSETPTHSQVWKWVRKVIQDHSVLRRKREQTAELTEFLQSQFGVADIELLKNKIEAAVSKLE